MLARILVTLIVLIVCLMVFAIGGLIADYILPHIGPLNHFLNSLPLGKEKHCE